LEGKEGVSEADLGVCVTRVEPSGFVARFALKGTHVEVLKKFCMG
jgi:hypothetical protein